MNRKLLFIALGILLGSALFAAIADAQGPRPRAPRAALGTGFTYQGQLKSSGTPYTGTCDFQFGLWDALTLGAQKGVTQTVTSVSVTNGYFTTILNGGNEFGATAFDGNARWLAITVRCPTGGGVYTALNPRQELTATPYALYALSAGNAITATTALTATNATTATIAMKTAYKNVIVVAKSGGHYNTISAALTSIVDNSASNRYLIWIAPGTYTETVTMKPFVDIEGAGELATKITQTGSGSDSTGTVLGVNNAELRFLMVENTGGSTYAIAIYNFSASPRLTHVTAKATGGTFVTRGVSNEASSPTMTNVTAESSGGTSNYGVLNEFSSPTMMNATAKASGGTINYGVSNVSSSSPTMMNVIATASGGTDTNYGVYNNSSSPTMTNVSATGSGGTNNRGVYNSFSSPTMMNVTAEASGGMNNHGIHNTSSTPTMMYVTAIASGGTSANFGVYNGSSSPITMTNVIATASGGTTSYGAYNDSSSPTIQNSTIGASGGTNNYGIYNVASSGTYTVTVNNSQIKGSTNAVRNDTEFKTYIGASKLEGGAVDVNGGTVKCNGAFDATYLFSANLCPNFQSGTATLGGGTGSVTNVYTVTFPSTFAATPKVIGTLHNDPAWNVGDTFTFNVRKITTTYFVVNVYRVDSASGWSQSLKIDWTAWE